MMEVFRSSRMIVPQKMPRCALLLLLVLGGSAARAQGVQPYVDHWDSLRTHKRSEGLMVNGREWGEWKFWDHDGHLMEKADFKSGERDGHVVIYYDNGQAEHDGYIRRGAQDSVMHSFYRNGKPMEQGSYIKGVKHGAWSYWYADGRPLLNELWEDSVCLSLDAWDKDSTQTLVKGEGVIRNYYASGTLSEETHYHYGVHSGEQKQFWPAGNLKMKGDWIAGVPQGEWNYWGSDGVLEKKLTYRDRKSVV